MTSKRLSLQTIGDLRPGILRPQYKREAVTPGMVHLGIGAFHRAHQAVFTEDCLNAGQHDWAIVAASLRSDATQAALQPQDNLYSLGLRGRDDDRVQVIGAISEIVVAPRQKALLLGRLCDPRIRIVSLTITEKGYTADIPARQLLATHPDIRHDLANPATPVTALGFLLEAIARRRLAGFAPFTILSCDNLPQNGRLVKALLLELAAGKDPILRDHIADHVSCPNSMVDRIVPATTDADRADLRDRLGLSDAWPVIAEPFFQWVVEDRFPQGRPAWERSGVEFVADVASSEKMKLRLLNGAHSIIAAMGQVAGYETVAEAVGNDAIRALIQAYWHEVSPTLPAGIDAPAYTGKLMVRFANSAIRHRTAQIASDGSQKIPQRWLASLSELRQQGRNTPILAFAIGTWLRSNAGCDERGRTLSVHDPVLAGWEDKPAQMGTNAMDVVAAYLSHRPIFGGLSLGRELVAEVSDALASIWEIGICAAAVRQIETKAPL